MGASYMAFCKNCGTEIEDNSRFCPECGSEIGLKNVVNSENFSINEKRLDALWFIVAILLPIVGVFGGFYYAFKGRKGAWAVVGLSIFCWVFYTVIVFSLGG